MPCRSLTTRCIEGGFCPLPDGGCERECLTEGARVCQANALVECQTNDAGCSFWAVLRRCDGGARCTTEADGGCFCFADCATPAARRCNGSVVEECAQDPDGGCFSYRPAFACDAGYACGEVVGGCYPIPAYPIGQACTDNGACQGPRPDGGGWCNLAWPSGYCTLACSRDQACTASTFDNRCIDGECRSRCSSGLECRVGYVCIPSASGGYCGPDCRSSPGVCAAGTLCDGDAGQCLPADSGVDAGTDAGDS